MTNSTLPVDPARSEAVAAADACEAEGRFLDAARVLEEVGRDERDPMIDVRIVALRHRAAVEIQRQSPVRPPPFPEPPDLFAGVVGAPEVPADGFDSDVLRSALHHHGCLIVRGLFDQQRCSDTRADIDQAFAAYDGRGFQPTEATAPWYARLDIEDGCTPLDPLAGAFLRSGGGVYGPCSPRAFVEYRQALADSGVIVAVERFLGEVAFLTVNKTVLRRIGGGAHPSWHQDGSYLGTDLSAVNLWVALSPCGGDTTMMGMDMLPGRRTQLAEMGTHGAVDPRAVAEEVVAEHAAASGRPVIRPAFGEGDGILFDQFFLHRSDTRPLPDERYAIESWFLSASTCPSHQIPVVAA